MASSSGNPEVKDLKAQLMKLMDSRDVIERDVQERLERLNSPGQPGMTGSLLDKEVRNAEGVIISITKELPVPSICASGGYHVLHIQPNASFVQFCLLFHSSLFPIPPSEADFSPT
jgi:hypothetical protein